MGSCERTWPSFRAKALLLEAGNTDWAADAEAKAGRQGKRPYLRQEPIKRDGIAAGPTRQTERKEPPWVAIDVQFAAPFRCVVVVIHAAQELHTQELTAGPEGGIGTGTSRTTGLGSHVKQLIVHLYSPGDGWRQVTRCQRCRQPCVVVAAQQGMRRRQANLRAETG
eukprot:365945-Chlamydomonas_euryale.AAC.11